MGREGGSFEEVEVVEYWGVEDCLGERWKSREGWRRKWW